MMLSQRHVAACCITLLLLATGVRANEDAFERGAELLAPFKKNLKTALVEGMQLGPAAAIGACRDQAPQIAQSLSVEGVTVGRSSHQLRNPANETPEWAAPLLKGYLEDGDDREPHAVPIADGRWGYVEPITVQPLCLACHGKDIAPEVGSQIDELYPDDSATGFDVGDLRGIFWAEFPAAE